MQQNGLKSRIKGYTISKYQKYIQYDLKNINFILNYFDIQISDRKLLNKIYLEKFYSKFLGGEREQKNSKFEANSFKMLKHKNPFLIVCTAEFRIEAFLMIF